MLKDIDHILISEEKIKEEVSKLGKELSQIYKDKNPLLICTLKGSAVFYADLIRSMDIPLELEFIRTSSYGNGTNSSKNIQMDAKGVVDLKNRHVILVEDIIDTGNTLKFLKEFFYSVGVADFKTCVLLNKPSRREVEIEADYICFKVPDEFVVGYGLDFAQKYRNLPFIGVLKEKVYKK